MTTIAYDGLTIASDSLVTQGGIIRDSDYKKYSHTTAGIFFMAGYLEDIARFCERFEPGERCEEDLNAEGFLFSDGLVYRVYADETFILEPMWKPWACGSGRDFAIAAMDHGKSAAEAVRYAATRDIHTGGPIYTLNTQTRKIKRVAG